jgi:hypothetical protein
MFFNPMINIQSGGEVLCYVIITVGNMSACSYSWE